MGDLLQFVRREELERMKRERTRLPPQQYDKMEWLPFVGVFFAMNAANQHRPNHLGAFFDEQRTIGTVYIAYQFLLPLMLAGTGYAGPY